MTRRRLRGVCREAGCVTITADAYCGLHPHRRVSGRDPRWSKLRAAVLAVEPLCRRCGDMAVEVDHITPLADGGAELDPANCQPLCRSCHTAKSAAET